MTPAPFLFLCNPIDFSAVSLPTTRPNRSFPQQFLHGFQNQCYPTSFSVEMRPRPAAEGALDGSGHSAGFTPAIGRAGQAFAAAAVFSRACARD